MEFDRYKYILDESLFEYLREKNVATSEAKLDSLIDNYNKATEYLVKQGGKRFRPMLMIETAIFEGANIEEVIPFACALELIHTFSLIHDDLPAIDNDDLRRGKPTLHKVYDEATAILVGDALLAKSVEIMSSFCNEANDLTLLKRRVKAMNIIISLAGYHGMILGEFLDTKNTEISDLDATTTINRLKTGNLIAAAMMVGSVLATGLEKNYYDIGMLLGELFQITDDILDVEGNEKILGKPVGSDQKRNLNTYISLIGLESTKSLLMERSAKLNDMIQDKEFLKPIVDMTLNRSK